MGLELFSHNVYNQLYAETHEMVLSIFSYQNATFKVIPAGIEPALL